MLQWAGEPDDGCAYTGVLEANTGVTGYNNAAPGSTVLDASQCVMS